MVKHHHSSAKLLNLLIKTKYNKDNPSKQVDGAWQNKKRASNSLHRSVVGDYLSLRGSLRSLLLGAFQRQIIKVSSRRSSRDHRRAVHHNPDRRLQMLNSSRTSVLLNNKRRCQISLACLKDSSDRTRHRVSNNPTCLRDNRCMDKGSRNMDRDHPLIHVVPRTNQDRTVSRVSTGLDQDKAILNTDSHNTNMVNLVLLMVNMEDNLDMVSNNLRRDH